MIAAAQNMRSNANAQSAPRGCSYTICRHAPAAHPALARLRVVSASAADPEPNPVQSDPKIIFPVSGTWEWQRAQPKQELIEVNQEATAAPWILNIIEAIHWASFPVGLYVTYYIFSNTAKIATYLPDGSDGVFWIILGLMFQIFGGGAANLMHAYEGWQITPFRNPIMLPNGDPHPPAPVRPPTQAEVDAIRIYNSNNQWLRTVTYQFLFTFQCVGLASFVVAVFGASAPTLALIALAAFVGLVGPKEPRLGFTRTVNGTERSVLPLSLPLFITFIVIASLNLWANVALFASVLAATAWPPTLLPWLKVIPANVGGVLAALASPVLTGLGGLYEGYVAESSFNQWDHFIAFVMLISGLGLSGAVYWHLVQAVV